MPQETNIYLHVFPTIGKKSLLVLRHRFPNNLSLDQFSRVPGRQLALQRGNLFVNGLDYLFAKQIIQESQGHINSRGEIRITANDTNYKKSQGSCKYKYLGTIGKASACIAGTADPFASLAPRLGGDARP